jgi:hypothetical protein
MNDLLQELIGRRVEVWGSGPDQEEVGVLEAVDRRWLRLRGEEGEGLCVFLFNVFRVREVPEEKEKKRGIFG